MIKSPSPAATFSFKGRWKVENSLLSPENGKGSAYYVAAEANEEILEWLIGNLTKELSLEQGLTVPKGVLARKISEGQYFYVNTTKEKKEICLPEGGYGVLTEAEYEKSLLLDAYQSELIVAK